LCPKDFALQGKSKRNTLNSKDEPVIDGYCCSWYYYKVEIQYKSISDHNGVVVQCAVKEFGITSKGSVPPCVQKILRYNIYSWHYYKIEIQYESFSDYHGVVARCAAKEFGITDTSKGSVPPCIQKILPCLDPMSSSLDPWAILKFLRNTFSEIQKSLKGITNTTHYELMKSRAARGQLAEYNNRA
jgi:hypothetical protein